MNLGALTTAFVPGPGCNDTIYGKIYSSGTARLKWHSLGQTDIKSCYPSAFTTPDAYYSPGICPSLWTSACGHVESIGTMTETRVTCCPVGYICATPQGEPWDTFSCTRFYTDPPKLIVPQDNGGKTTYMETTLAGPIVGYANQIEVRFQEKDFETAASTTESSSSLLTGTQASASPSKLIGTNEPTNTAAGSGNGTDSNSTGDNEGKKGLAAGAYAGIGVGVAAALIALAGVLIYFTKKRKNANSGADASNEEWMQVTSRAEMASSAPVYEAGQRDIGEVRGDQAMPVELDPRTRLHQLE